MAKLKHHRKKHSGIFYAIENCGIITQGTWVERREAIKVLEKEFGVPWKEILKNHKYFKIIKVRVTRLPNPRKKQPCELTGRCVP